LIEIDRASVTSKGMLGRTLAHEMCHVAVRDDILRLHHDDQGNVWQACMLRFSEIPAE
jgi:hypothetical protein